MIYAILETNRKAKTSRIWDCGSAFGEEVVCLTTFPKRSEASAEAWRLNALAEQTARPWRYKATILPPGHLYYKPDGLIAQAK